MCWDNIFFSASVEALEVSSVVSNEVWNKVLEDKVHKVKGEG